MECVLKIGEKTPAASCKKTLHILRKHFDFDNVSLVLKLFSKRKRLYKLKYLVETRLHWFELTESDKVVCKKMKSIVTVLELVLTNWSTQESTYFRKRFKVTRSSTPFIFIDHEEIPKEVRHAE